ncbi:hypothetical protein ACEN2T_17905 [Pseudomonas sp. W22_MBD1_FP4]|uniref:hypothetical protein n=1 Tax=Pseudomonas sp. W22_MBD1_FP4 TaxID=3240272 RepID=UPI003F99312B
MNTQQKGYVLPTDLDQVLIAERISVSPTGEQTGQGAEFYAFAFDMSQEDAVNAFGGTPSDAVGKVLSLLGKPFSVAQTSKIISDAAEVIRQIGLAETEQQATEDAASARGYVKALADQHLVEHTQWRQFCADIDAARRGWQRPLRGQGGNYQ